MKQKNTRSIQKYFCLLFAILFLTGCDKPIFHDRPTIEACKDYLTGQHLLVEKGAILDTTWIIQTDEFISFDIQSITSNRDKSKSAKVQFELKYQGKGLKVDGTIKYRMLNDREFVQML